MTPGRSLLAVRDLDVDYGGHGGWRNVIRDVDFTLAPGERVGLAGESGCGKSTLASLLLGERRDDRRITRGGVLFDGIDLFAAPRRTVRTLRGARIAMVPQNSGAALTPTSRIGALFAETLRCHEPGLSRSAIIGRIAAGLAEVGLPQPEEALRRYPHQFSGGQQQRISLALALICDPDLLVLDEPTTGQDALIRRAIVALLDRLAAARHMGMLYISHDLATLAEVCDRIAVMYAGEIVEDGPAMTILERPAHPYTRMLVAALPRLDRPPVVGLGNTVSDHRPSASGCRFAPRCPIATPPCGITRQVLEPVAPDHSAACMRLSTFSTPDLERRFDLARDSVA